MKSTNKKFVSKIIYLSNLKFLIKSPIIISFFVLQLVATISISLVINFHFENSLQAGMANVKTMWFIKYCSDILTNAIFIFVISYILFVKHKDNGIQNIEIRSGVKLKNIFFLRVAIAVTLLYSTYLINFCFSGIIFSISNIPISVLEKNILPVTGFIFLFIFIFHVFCDLFLVSFKIVLSAIIISLTTIAVSIGPIFPSIGWHATNEKLKPLTTMNEITSTNAKLNYGLNFLEFIKSNSEYEWLLDDFSLLEYKNEEPVCQPNDPMCRYVGWGTNTEAWLSGLWLGIDDNVFEENIKVQLNNGVGLFLKDLSKTNFTFEGASYNKLFSYLAKIANDITTYNEVDHNISATRGFAYDMRFNSDINSNPSEVSWENSELANIQIKEKAYVYVEPMYIMYFIIFGILEFATYKIFKHKLLK
jgi:hypothetical protein